MRLTSSDIPTVSITVRIYVTVFMALYLPEIPKSPFF